MTKRNVFLCHASEDKPSVRSVALGLSRYGISSWLDEAEMKVGDVLVQKISEGIEKADKFCVFLTENSVSKPWVKFELHQAVTREINQGNIFILPVVLHECSIPGFLQAKMYIDFKNWDNYSPTIERLAVAIAGEIVGLPLDFVLDGLNDSSIEDEVLLSLSIDQCAIELKLRRDKWDARRVGTIRNHTNLTMKQVLNYCETSEHIILHPIPNSKGEIFYGMQWRVMDNYENETEYKKAVNRFIQILIKSPIQNYSSEVVSYFLSFYA